MDIEFIGGEFIPRTKPQQVEKSIKPISFGSEEIAKLQRDIEAIDDLIKDKEETIKWEQDKWYYKHYKKVIAIEILIMDLIFTLSMFLITLNSSFPVFIYAALNTLCVPLLPIINIVDVKKWMKRTKNLETEIDYLEEIKKQKLSEIEQLKQRNTSISSSTHSCKEMISQLELYKEALKVFQNMQQEPSKDTIEQIKGVIEQIEKKGKQKIIKRKSLYGE